MNAATQKLQFKGLAGAIEAMVDRPEGDGQPKTAVIAHPHPLFGGTMHNKVVQTLARAFVQEGWTVVRFNFRGVGASQGVHGGGQPEVQDMLAVIDQAAAVGPLALAGFSFGAFVASHAAAALDAREHELQQLVLVGTAASRFAVAPVASGLHERTLVLHGEHDDTVPLTSVLDWARPQALPVTVIPAGGHFFHGQLALLKSMVVRHLRGRGPH